ARARRPRPLRLPEPRRRDPAGRRPLVPGPRPAGGAGDVGRFAALPAGRPAGDRPPGRDRRGDRSRDEGRLARSGDGTAGRAARLRGNPRSRPGALRPEQVLGLRRWALVVILGQPALELAASRLESADRAAEARGAEHQQEDHADDDETPEPDTGHRVTAYP